MQKFYAETRLDTISEEKSADLKQNINAEKIIIETGVECLDDAILRNCVNKNMLTENVGAAVSLVHKYNMIICANIGIGIPFLTERKNIELAEYSAKKAFSLGFDEVILFPYHVKPGTLLSVLYEGGLYKPVSLWALAEVLQRLPEELIEKTSIAWY